MQQKKRGLFRSTSRLFLRGVSDSNKDDTVSNKRKDYHDDLAVETALAKAKLAVLYDTSGNVEGAISAYTETIELLSQVNDKSLNKIHDMYAHRIQVLTNTTTTDDDDSANGDNFGDPNYINDTDKQEQEQREEQQYALSVTIDPTPSLCMSREESEISQPSTPSAFSIADPWVIHHLPSTSASSSTTTRTSASSFSLSSTTSNNDLSTVFENEEQKAKEHSQLFEFSNNDEFYFNLPKTIITSSFLNDDIIDEQVDSNNDESNFHNIDMNANVQQSQPQQQQQQSSSSFYWALMERLKQSMVQGGYLTDRLYVPKQLWYNQQANHHILSNIDYKLALTEHLLGILKSLKQHQYQKMDTMRIFVTLQLLEEALIKSSAVMSISSSPTTNTATSTNINTTNTPTTYLSSQTSTLLNAKAKKWRDSINRQIQAATAWKNNKFVDRMRSEHNTPKMIDDRYNMYIRTLIKLFSAAQILDQWHTEFTTMDHNTSSTIHQQIISKLELCTDMLGHVVCTNVLEDFKLLWESWVARGDQYMND
ncbi:hypothetical protein BDC45DRAFT_572404 [Circinella umbellata]|nr:hypothetical protein BDC45DRAFT_572404 [Circinella umbellata]